MKKISLLLFLFTIGTVQAQEWVYSLTEAQAIAAKENKHVLLVFSGSDWCAPCRKLEKNIWTSSEFQNLSKNSLVLLQADFPRRRKNKLSKEQQAKNNALAATYNTKGHFPLVVVLNKNGRAIGSLGYENISPKDYYKKIEKLIHATL